MKPIIVSLSFLLLVINFSICQNTVIQSKKLSPKELRFDLKLFKNQLFTVHPGLDAYTPKIELEAAFAKIENELTMPMTPIEFYRLLTPLHSLIGNGHTEILAPKSYLTSIGSKSDTPRFPFDLYQDKNGIYILRNCSVDLAINPRDKILSINGMPIDSLFDALVSQQTRDGFNLTLPAKKVIESFRSHYAFQIGLPEVFILKIKNHMGEVFEKSVTGQTLLQRKTNRNERYPNYQKSYPNNELPAADLKLEDFNAILTVRTMGNDFFKESVGGYQVFFKGVFEKITAEKSQNLILDLRDNHGGEENVGIEIMRYLTDEKFNYYTEWTPLVNKIEGRKNYQGLNRLTHWLLTKQVEKTANGFSVKGLKETQNIEPYSPCFRGQIYVLTNANTFSAAGELTGHLKSRTNAIFIGEEPGGNPVQNVSSTTIPLLLKNSGIRVMMPFVLNKTDTNLKNTGRGVLPDFPMENLIEDVLAEKDAIMNFVLEKIEKSKQLSK